MQFLETPEEWSPSRFGSVSLPFQCLFINDLPSTTFRKFIYADDICLATQDRTFTAVKTHSVKI